ncbi:MAG: ATP-dependent helicase/nuclease subunit A, partial [Verrucomicrobiales bacterium]
MIGSRSASKAGLSNEPTSSDPACPSSPNAWARNSIAATHPGDTLSWQHLWLTPFGKVLERLAWSQADCVRETLTSVHRDGFEAVIRDWLGRLAEVGVELDDFSRGRVETLCDSAATFDARGDRSLTR